MVGIALYFYVRSYVLSHRYITTMADMAVVSQYVSASCLA